MSKIKIAIIEDEVIIADDLKAILEDIGYECPEPCCNYADATEMLEKEMPDLVMLDILLHGRPDGIKLAKHIRATCNIPFLFLTANRDDATFQLAKQTRPDAYLVKPFQKAALHTAVEVALHNFNYVKNNNAAVRKNPLKDMLFIKDGDYFHKVAFDDILYLCSEHVYVTVCTVKKNFLVRATLQEYVENLDPQTFIRVHRSYAVNIKKIDKINSDHIIINNTEVPVSKQHRQQLLALLNLG